MPRPKSDSAGCEPSATATVTVSADELLAAAELKAQQQAAAIKAAQEAQAKADELAERATEARPDDPGPLLVLSAHRGRQGDLEGAALAHPRQPGAGTGRGLRLGRGPDLLVGRGGIGEGDVVADGHREQRRIVEGDVITAAIEGLGVQRNPVVREPEPS